ncbi:MAG: hypothetical protein AB7O37_19405 [Vicinamibacteria bacterium]
MPDDKREGPAPPVVDPALRLEQAKLRVEVVKALLAVLGAAFVFWLVQRPESALNREASKETIARERARLLLEWVREPDSEKRGEALAIISAAYGESDNKWLGTVEAFLREKAHYESLDKLIREKQMALEKLQSGMVSEVHRSDRPGFGPQAAAIYREIARLDSEILKLTMSRDANHKQP